jgi:hypothetical protein
MNSPIDRLLDDHRRANPLVCLDAFLRDAEVCSWELSF